MKQRCSCSLLIHHVLLLLPLAFIAGLLSIAGLLAGANNAVLHKSMGERNGGRVAPPAPKASGDPHT